MKITLGLALIFCSMGLAHGQTSKKSYNLLVGSYTNTEKTNGIAVYNFDANTGEASLRSKVTTVQNPSFLTISNDRKNVYAVSEVADGKVNAFSFNSKSGELQYLNSVSSGGNGPCYVSVDEKKQYVFAANYGGGSLSAIKINKDGSLSNQIQTIQQTGSGVNQSRQSKPHVHSVVLSPDDRFLFAADLGTDKVNIYRFNATAERPLAPAKMPFATVEPGGGPRHLSFHPNGKYAYLVLEMEAAVAVFDYHNGELKSKQSISMLSPDFKGKVGAADIHISPDGKFLYTTNRGEANDIIVCAIAKDGRLKYAGRHSGSINNPRNFAIDPTGKFVLIANQNTNDIVIFKRNSTTGLLTETAQKITVDKPVCVKFVEAD